MSALTEWRTVIGNPDFSESQDWLLEAEYRGLRVSCGLNEGGPVAWVGHTSKELWFDSVACDGSVESGKARAIALADLVFTRPEWEALLFS